MLGTIYSGLSGMNSFSRGLSVISNNVANLNTAGYKMTVPLFSDVVFRSGAGALTGSPGSRASGAGVDVDTSRLSFKQGELRDTGNALDVAIDGNGFFVLERDGKRVYTRAGQFEFDPDGQLIERGTRAKVMMSSDNAAIGTLDINEFRTFAPKATTEVKVSGTLARAGTQRTYELANIPVIDTGGGRATVKAKFVRDAADPLKWTVEVVDSGNAVLGTGELAFNADGTPANSATGVTFTVKPADTAEFDVTLRFGTDGHFNGVSSLANSTQSSLQVFKQDGLELGALTKFTFDEEGRLKLSYSNGEDKTVATLVLAQFDAPEELQSLGGALFAAVANHDPKLGAALKTPCTKGSRSRFLFPV